MTDKEEKYSMDFLGSDDSNDNSKGSKSTKEIKTNTTNVQGINKEKTSAGKGTSRQGSNNKDQSINKELNINKIINSINNHIDIKFNTVVDTLKATLVDDNNMNEFIYNISNEYHIIRNSVMKLRKSGRVKQAFNKLDTLLGVK